FDAAVTQGTAVIVFELEPPVGVGSYQSELLGDSNFIVYQEFAFFGDGGSTQPVHYTPGLLTLGPEWHHVEVCFDFATASRKIVFDGTSTTATGVPKFPSPGPFKFGLPYAVSLSAPAEVHIDNVLVDTSACP